MGSLLVDLLPFGLGMAITPSVIAITILLLGSKRPVGNTLAFAAAFAFVYSGLSALVVGATAAAGEPLLSDDAKGTAAVLAGATLVVLGVATVVRHRRREGPPARSRLLAIVDDANGTEAFGLGVGLAVLNPNVPILLGGLAAVAAADVSDRGRTVGAMVLVGASLVGIAGPLLWYVFDRPRAIRDLGRIKSWLGRHQTAVNLAVLFGFGALFVVKGIAALS